LEANTEDTKE